MTRPFNRTERLTTIAPDKMHGRHASLSGAMRLVLHELGLLNDRSKSLYLAHCLIHLQVNKPIHFHGILHRQFLDDWLDEAAHDHARRFRLA